MPWAKVDTATNIITDIFENEPDLDDDEADQFVVMGVGDDVEIGDSIVAKDDDAAAPAKQGPDQKGGFSSGEA